MSFGWRGIFLKLNHYVCIEQGAYLQPKESAMRKILIKNLQGM